MALGSIKKMLFALIVCFDQSDKISVIIAKSKFLKMVKNLGVCVQVFWLLLFCNKMNRKRVDGVEEPSIDRWATDLKIQDVKKDLTVGFSILKYLTAFVSILTKFLTQWFWLNHMFTCSKLFINNILIIFSPGEVLIEVKNVGICGSDVHYWTHGRGARYFLTSTLSEWTRESNGRWKIFFWKPFFWISCIFFHY